MLRGSNLEGMRAAHVPSFSVSFGLLQSQPERIDLHSNQRDTLLLQHHLNMSTGTQCCSWTA